MPYVDLAGLSRFAGKSKDFASSACAGPDMANWQKTAAAGAVSFSPVPEMPIDPVVNFMFTETGPASGTKSPNNPSTITGVTQVKVTRCGKNLLPSTSIYSTMASRGITVSYNADKSIHLKGTASSSNLPYMRFFTEEPGVVPSVLSSGTTVTISLSCPDSNVYGALYDSDSPALRGDATIVYPGTPVTHTISANAKTVNFSLIVTRSAVVDCDVYCQIEFGQTATAWEAPADEDYAIPLNGTYYGGSVDLSTGTMTVTREGVVFDGSENITQQTTDSDGFYQYNLPVPSYASTISTNACTHLLTGGSNRDRCYVRLSGGTGLRIFVSEYSTVEAVKNWLASEYSDGTPLTVVYELATPYTVTLAPTQIYSLSQPDPYAPRTNTVYSDQVSVQAGYPKSPQASQTELTNAIVSLGGNV